MAYLIDGYNLLHAMGALRGRVGPQGLEKARLRLLGLLQGVFAAQAAEITVVFDAEHAPPGAVEAFDHEGIHVRFAIHQHQADDLIEELIQHASAPRQLRVVSDDHRLQQAAHRRHCTAVGCLDFLDELKKQRGRSRLAAKEPEKSETLSPAETEHWLHEFAELADDPALKEPFYPYDSAEPPESV
jgi:predicted RNA-binding protein with PIN domain